VDVRRSIPTSNSGKVGALASGIAFFIGVSLCGNFLFFLSNAESGGKR